MSNISGPSVVQTTSTPPTGSSVVATNQLAVTNAAQQLPAQAARTVTVRSKLNSSQNVYVGAAGVTVGTGYELSPGDSMTFPVDNVNRLYVIAPAAGATITWAAD